MAESFARYLLQGFAQELHPVDKYPQASYHLDDEIPVHFTESFSGFALGTNLLLVYAL